MEDEDGMVGVALTKDLVCVAGASLRQHISTLAPYVLSVSELLRYVPSPYLACCIAVNFACLDASPVVSASIYGCCAVHRFHFRRCFSFPISEQSRIALYFSLYTSNFLFMLFYILAQPRDCIKRASYQLLVWIKENYQFKTWNIHALLHDFHDDN
jgi:hypothetical protein